MRSERYEQLQQEMLQEETQGIAAAQEVEEGVAPLEAGRVVIIKPKHDTTKALQVKPNTHRLELAELAEEGSSNQRWRILERNGRIQHCGTGLFLDAEVVYLYLTREHPWETAGAALYVKPSDSESMNQRWLLDGDLIRHLHDGRVLDVNFWELQAGQGVNLNVPHSNAFGCSWVLEDADKNEGEEEGAAEAVEGGVVDGAG